MNQQRFNPKVFKNKKTVTVKIPHYMGIRYLYDWSESKQQYIKRSKGMRYSAIIKLNGKQKEKFFESIEKAKSWRESGGIEAALTEKEMFFEDLIKSYFKNIASRINSSTLKTYKNNSKHLAYFDNMVVTKITHKVVDQWLEKVKDEKYVKTCKSYKLSFEKELHLLRQIFNYYIDYHNECFISPMRKKHQKDCIINLQKYQEAKNRNQNRYLRDEEIKQFLGYMKEWSEKEPSKKPYYLLALFQLRTGTRVGEACAVNFNDIRIEDSRPYVNIGKSVQWGRGKGEKTFIQHFTKTVSSRKVLLPDDLMSVLLDLRDDSNEMMINRLIFSSNGKPLSYRSIQYHYDQAFIALGLEWRSSHILRHSYSTEYLRITRDQHSLSRILGHTNLRQTEHYAKITDGMTQDSFDQFNNHIKSEHENVIDFKSKLVVAGKN